MSEHIWSGIALLLLTLLSTAVVGLLGIWVALGRGYWFARVAVVGALLMLLLLIPAYEPLVVFVIQLVIAVPVLITARRRRERCLGRPMWQFSVRDLLCATAVVALVAAVGTSAPTSVWQSWHFLEAGFWFDVPEVPPWVFACVMGALAGVATCLAAWMALGQARRWIRLVTMIVGLPVAIVGMTWWLMYHSFWSHRLNPYWFQMGGPPRPGISCEELLLVCSVLSMPLIVVWIWLLRASWRSRVVEHASSDNDRTHAGDRWWRWPARAAWVLLSLAMLFPLAWAYTVLATPLAVYDSPLPKTNGYDELIALGKQMDGVNVPSFDPRLPPPDSSTPREFIEFEKQHRALLDRAHACLDAPCYVPLHYDLRDISVSDLNVDEPRRLARAMVAAGHAAMLRGDQEQATNRLVDVIRLGRQASHKGIIIHWLIGNAIESSGRTAIHHERDRFDAKQRRAIVSSLVELGEVSEPFESARTRETAWTQATFGWPGRLVWYVDDLAGGIESVDVACPQTEKHHRALHRILLVELALEDYRDEHGDYPERLETLVPDRLERLPLDPFGDGPLRYRRTKEGCQVYSVGPDGKDDGGDVYRTDTGFQ